jgi:hypothetical protein
VSAACTPGALEDDHGLGIPFVADRASKAVAAIVAQVLATQALATARTGQFTQPIETRGIMLTPTEN